MPSPGDREGVSRSVGEMETPVALPPFQAMLYSFIFNSQLQASQECRAGLWYCLWLTMSR